MSTKTKTSEKQKPPKAPVSLPADCESLLGKAQICAALGVSLRTLQSMLAAGEYPKADTKIGIFPRWRVATHNAWIESRCTKED